MTEFLINASFLIHLTITAEIFIGFCAVIILVLLAQKHYVHAKIFGAATILTGAFTYLIKEITRVDRPIEAMIGLGDYAFPSGHTSLSFALLTFLIFYIQTVNKNPLTQKISIVVFTIGAVIISASRLILHVHTFWQVIAGAILGIAVTVWMTRKFYPKYKFNLKNLI